MDDDTNIVEIKREGGRFVKGQSGNPRGGNKPKLFRDYDGQKREIQDLFREGAPAVFEVMVKMILDHRTPAGARANLIKEYFNRAVGKAAITLTAPEAESYAGVDWTKLDDDALTKVMTLISQNGSSE